MSVPTLAKYQSNKSVEAIFFYTSNMWSEDNDGYSLI